MMDEKGDEIAAVIVEPVAGNMCCVPPVEGFLETLRRETENTAPSLFRRSHVRFPYLLPRCPGPLSYSSGHDLSWKIIGGGLPAAAYGGRREIMNCIAPDGSVYQAGTLSGNPLAVTAGIETLKQMMAIPDFDKILEKKTKDLLTGWKQAADKAGVPLVCHQSGSMFGIFFSEKTCSIITTPAAPMRRSSKPGSSPC